MRLVLIHSMDPRGTKVGGMETHVRQLIRRAPSDMRVTLVGVDETGDCPLGQMTPLVIAGRTIDFVPVVHVPFDEQREAAKTVGRSLTFRMALGLARHLPALRRLLRGTRASVEVERFEFAPFARLLGHPLVVLVHNEHTRGDRMDSVLSRHWWVFETAEWLAFRLAQRIFCVTPRLKDRLAEEHPSQAGKADVLTVSVDTELFHPVPFDMTDGRLRLVYAGRLDAVKHPELMFRVVSRLHARLGDAFEFHYAGAHDPHRYEEFRAIEAVTVRHGPLLPEAVAALLRRSHIGLMTSLWEGMPCFLLETLSTGRPFAGVRLPQFDRVVVEGVSGRLVERSPDIDATADAVTGAVLQLWDDIRAGRIDPDRVHTHIRPFSVDQQLGRLIDAHRELAMDGTDSGVAVPVER